MSIAISLGKFRKFLSHLLKKFCKVSFIWEILNSLTVLQMQTIDSIDLLLAGLLQIIHDKLGTSASVEQPLTTLCV